MTKSSGPVPVGAFRPSALPKASEFEVALARKSIDGILSAPSLPWLMEIATRPLSDTPSTPIRLAPPLPDSAK